MEPKELVILGLQVSIWATVFGFGLAAKSGDLTYLFRHTNLLARSIVAMLVVMPVVALILARVFGFEHRRGDRDGGTGALTGSAPPA